MGAEAVMDTLPLVVLLVIVNLLLLAAILLYRRRTLQLRITLLSMILQILSYGLVGLYVYFGANKLDASPHLLFSSVMPLAAFILTFLAFRAIRRDQLLLRALDRLR
jgi:glucan phosphoethanolaminetransferase (alkaline phosphatase superfamily)